eukprot:7826895-Alexandrium_andersonii.AAC.1
MPVAPPARAKQRLRGPSTPPSESEDEAVQVDDDNTAPKADDRNAAPMEADRTCVQGYELKDRCALGGFKH